MTAATAKAENLMNDFEEGSVKSIELLKNQTREFMEAVKTPEVSAELHKIQGQLNDIGRRVQHRAKELDDHVHSNPYIYLASAFGVGFLAGQVMSLRKSRKSCP
jgi:ElaB/YqjD/DUF883 family membrane-anchored ribosome-binding protein